MRTCMRNKRYIVRNLAFSQPQTPVVRDIIESIHQIYIKSEIKEIINKYLFDFLTLYVPM